MPFDQNLDKLCSDFKSKLNQTSDINNHVDEEESQTYTFTNPVYTEEFLNELNSIYKSKKFTDIILVCGEKNAPINNHSIECHRVVLASFSSYFNAMFSSNLSETLTNRVFMPDFDFDSLKNVIDYAYSGVLKINVSNVQHIFHIATILHLNSVLSACCDFMESQLELSNALEIFQFAKRHMCSILEAKSRQFINRYFADMFFKDKEFLLMNDVDVLCDSMSSDELEIENEEFLLLAILNWIDYDVQNRSKHFERLFFDCVRLNLINDIEKLKNIVHESQFKDLFLQNTKVFDYIQSYLNNREVINMKKRSGMLKAEQCFMLIGGNCDLDDGSYVNCFNPYNGEKFFLSKDFLEKTNKYSPLSNGYFHIENAGVCVTSDNRVFVAGGVYVYHEYKLFNYHQQNKKKKNRKMFNAKKQQQEQQRSEQQEDFINDEINNYFSNKDNLKDGKFYTDLNIKSIFAIVFPLNIKKK
jgi:hypothetical protein